MSPPVVLCAGRVYCDLVFTGLTGVPVPGDEIYADGLSLHTGGGAAITAYYLAQLGCTAELCAHLPAPPFLQQIQQDLEGHVGLHHSSANTEQEPQVTVVLTGAVDRSFVTRRVGAALPGSYRDSIASHKALTSSVNHLHVGELATLLDHPELLTIARSNNWTVSLDCAWDREAMTDDNAKALIERVDIFLPNESEFAELQKIGIDNNTAPLTIVKQGAKGATAYSRTGNVISAAEQTLCVDTTGAGDAFNAGFIHAWLHNESVDACLASGNRCGAIAVGKVGGVG